MKHTIRSKAGGRVVIERHEDVVQITVVSAATNAATVTMGPHEAAVVLMAIGVEADKAMEAMEAVMVESVNLGPAAARAAAGSAFQH